MSDDRHPVVQGMIDAIQDVFDGRVIDEHGTMPGGGPIIHEIIPDENGGFTIRPLFTDNSYIEPMISGGNKMSPEWQKLMELIKKAKENKDGQ